MKGRGLLKPLVISTAAGIGVTLAVNMLRGGNPLNRLGFAVFFAALAAGLTWSLSILFKLNKLTTPTVYALVFILIHIGWALLRG